MVDLGCKKSIDDGWNTAVAVEGERDGDGGAVAVVDDDCEDDDDVM